VKDISNNCPLRGVSQPQTPPGRVIARCRTRCTARSTFTGCGQAGRIAALLLPPTHALQACSLADLPGEGSLQLCVSWQSFPAWPSPLPPVHRGPVCPPRRGQQPRTQGTDHALCMGHGDQGHHRLQGTLDYQGKKCSFPFLLRRRGCYSVLFSPESGWASNYQWSMQLMSHFPLPVRRYVSGDCRVSSEVESSGCWDGPERGALASSRVALDLLGARYRSLQFTTPGHIDLLTCLYTHLSPTSRSTDRPPPKGA